MKQPLIELRHIFRTFGEGENELTVLNDINISINEGEFVAIIGASGSGKSTLMNIVGCLDKPSKGEYLFLGKDISKFSKDDLSRLRREYFGFVFQSYNLLPYLTASENVEVPAIYTGTNKNEREQRAKELLATLGLEHRVDYPPNKLSGGQQQRVSICRALMNGGQIILADEPTGALDSKSGIEVLELLKELSEAGHTIILITHDKNVASNAHRIIEIKDGRILSDKSKIEDKEGNRLKLTTKKEPTVGFEIYEAVKMAVNSLKKNVFRTILTLLGIVIGVASVITMLAIGNGAKNDVVNRISSMGTNMLSIQAGIPGSRWNSGVRSLVLSDTVAINALDNIEVAMPEAKKGVTIRYKGKDHQTNLLATSSSYAKLRNWSVSEGIFFSPRDETRVERVVVLGEVVVDALFEKENPIGKFVVIDSIMFRVIGVMSRKGFSSWGEDQDDVLIVPYPTGNLHIIGQTSLKTIRVGIIDVTKSEETEESIRELLIKRHTKEDFRVRNMASLVQDMEQAQNTLTILLGSIAAISLLVGGIGVMNIMLVSVTERTKEIGIRVATGARTKNIMQQFLIESLIVAAFGGIIGVVLGLLIAFIVGRFDIPIFYSLPPILLAFGCAFFTGLIFGYLPAKKAANLDPIVALQGE